MRLRATVICAISLIICGNVSGREKKVTPRELYYKISSAMMHLMETGEAGLKDISRIGENNPYIWKGTYIFVMNCDKHIFVAHPNKKLIGDTKIWNLQDPTGKHIMPSLCAVAKEHRNGGWIEYKWPKKQTKGAKTTSTRLDSKMIARKVSFSIRVPGTPYQVCGGIYNDTVSLKWLNTRVRIWMR